MSKISLIGTGAWVLTLSKDPMLLMSLSLKCDIAVSRCVCIPSANFWKFNCQC